MPMFPLEVAMLPGEELPLRIFEPRYTALVSDCLATDDPAFGVVLIAAGREVGGGDTRSDVGALAHITECADFGDGRYRLQMCDGLSGSGYWSGIPTIPTRGLRWSFGPTSRVRPSTSTRSATSRIAWLRYLSGSPRPAERR